MHRQPAKLAHILYPAANVGLTAGFYHDLFDLPIRFVDGERFAMLGETGALLAIAGADEQVADLRVAASFKVHSVEDTLTRAAELGAVLQRPTQEGAHETRAVLRDPDGNPVVVYAPHHD